MTTFPPRRQARYASLSGFVRNNPRRIVMPIVMPAAGIMKIIKVNQVIARERPER
jgi:hypothetical protein